jgi:hypothetical protein
MSQNQSNETRKVEQTCANRDQRTSEIQMVIDEVRESFEVKEGRNQELEAQVQRPWKEV